MHVLHLRPFIDELARTRGLDPAAVTDELLAAARRGAVRVLGERTPLELELGPLGEVRVAQALTVREFPEDRARELSLLDARRFAADAGDGDELLLPIHYTHNPSEADERARHQAHAHLLPLPLHAAGLWDALSDELNAALLRHFPAPAFAAGSLGALLAGGGGWLRGRAARAGEASLRVDDVELRFTRTQPLGGHYSLKLCCTFTGPAGAVPWTLRVEDNAAVFGRTAELPTDERAQPAVDAELAALAAEVAARGVGGMSEFSAAARVLAAAIAPAAPDSLWAWCHAALPELLLGTSGHVDHPGGRLRWEISDVYPPVAACEGFGSSAVALRLADAANGAEIFENIPLGALSPAALTTPVVDLPDLRALVETFKRWLAAHLEHHVATRGAALEMHYLYAFDGHFPLVELLAARAQHGPPPPPPVPPLDAAARARAAATLRPASHHTRARVRERLGRRTAIAVYEAGPFAVVLADDLSRSLPHADAFIGLLPTSGEHLCEVLRVDVWNPPSRAVVDGDALAFRRLCEWLRAGITGAGLDATVEYARDDEDDDDDDDDDEDEDDAEPAEPLRLTTSEWLRFGLPDCGDSFLVDWRHQWHVVFAGAGIGECFGGIYGLDGARREALATRDRHVWRTFLREVIDPRF